MNATNRQGLRFIYRNHTNAHKLATACVVGFDNVQVV